MHRAIAKLGKAALLSLLLACGDSGSPDTEPPSIVFVSPRDAFLMETVTIAVDVDDDRAVAGVRFMLNGVPLGPEDQTDPYMMTWNTLGYADGFYTLTATARDATGNESTTQPITVHVLNGLL